MGNHRLTRFVTAAAISLPVASFAQFYVAEDVTPTFAGAYLARGNNDQYGGTLILPGGISHAGTFQSGVWTDLNPPGASDSWANETYRDRTVGYATFSGAVHATVWRGTGGAFLDLHPGGAIWSAAWGIQGREIVGQTGLPGGSAHAGIWSGNAFSYSDVHPAGWANSYLIATDGKDQVGGVQNATFSIQHAAVWSGTAGSFVDLHPAGYDTSAANHTFRGNQVGVATILGLERAVRWSGTAASVVDMTPPGADSGQAYAISRHGIVGYYRQNPGGPLRACIFDGRFGFIDLHAFLPPSYTASVAYGIDENGNITGYASSTLWPGQTRAIIWRR